MLDIGLEIRILRERHRISAKELAERIGLSQSQISRLENGQRRIDTRILERIAGALEVDPSYFFRGEEGPPAAVLSPSRPLTVGRLIRQERRRQHVSAEELALRVARPKALIHAIEDGKRELDAELAERISRALHFPTARLLEAQTGVIDGLKTRVDRLQEALAEVHRAPLQLGPASPAEGRGAAVGAGPGATGASASPLVQRRGVPILGTLADGYPRRFDETGRPVAEVEDYLYLPELGASDAFALHVSGSSMESEAFPSFREGDLVVFAGGVAGSASHAAGMGSARSRDFVFARVEGEEPVFRRVFFDTGGQVRLQPLDLNHAALVVPRERVLGLWRLVAHVARH